MEQQFAYSVIYTATRSGATKGHITFYRTNEQISTAEQFAQMVNDISRQAVATGQANNVEDVTVNSVSLLNPMAAMSAADFTQQRDTASKTDAEEAFLAFHGAIDDILQSYEHRPSEAMDMLEQVKQEVMIRAQLASDLNDVVEGREYSPKKCGKLETHVTPEYIYRLEQEIIRAANGAGISEDLYRSCLAKHPDMSINRQER